MTGVIEVLLRYPQYGMLAVVGAVWVRVHCANRCGPLSLGLDLAGRLADPERSAIRVWLDLWAFLLGRMAVGALLGALAGAAGLPPGLPSPAPALAPAVLLGQALIGAGLWKTVRRVLLTSAPPRIGAGVAALADLARRRRGLLQKLLLGLVLGLLPCRITAFALLLGASTESPGHGAALAVLLVLLSSTTLLPFGLDPGRMPTAAQRRLQDRLVGPLLLLSGIGLLLVAFAANGWV